MVAIASIVEGQGDAQALPILVRRIAERLNPPVYPAVLHPIRIPKHRVIKANELERATRLAASAVTGSGGILLLLDSDDDCPAILGPQLLDRMMAGRPDVVSATVLVKCEFEAWFLAGAESLRGKRDLPNNLANPPDPEMIRGAKRWLSERMPKGRPYRETLDQAPLAALVDLEMVYRFSPSFRKFHKEVVKLCT